MIDLQDIITTKQELLSKETYSRGFYGSDEGSEGSGVLYGIETC